MNFAPVDILYHGTGHYPPGARIGPACWPHWDLLVAVRGLFAIKASRGSGTRSCQLDEGDAMLLPPHVRFRGEGKTPGSSLWVVHFRDPARGTRDCVRVFRQGAADAFSRGLLTEIASVYNAKGEAERAHYLTSLVEALLQKLHRNSRGRRGKFCRDSRLRLWRVEDLETRREEPPDVAALAAEAGLSVSHHRAVFTKAFGVTPGRHLRQLRIVYARKLLKETRLPMKQIAAAAGYKDAVTFHRAFASVCGCTPGQFRGKSPRPCGSH